MSEYYYPFAFTYTYSICSFKYVNTPPPSFIPIIWLAILHVVSKNGSIKLKYSDSSTELLADSVAQLVRAWQAICQVVGSLRHCHFFLGMRPTCRVLDFVYL